MVREAAADDRAVTISDDDMRARVAKHDEIREALSNILGGQPPELQGTALAECLGMWLAGYRTDARTRAALLDNHLRAVQHFVDLWDEKFRKGRK